MPEGNHTQRRWGKLADRRLAKRDARMVAIPLTEEMIPPGSLLSDETLALIREGKLGMAKYLPPGAPIPDGFSRLPQQPSQAVPIQGTNPHPYKGGRSARTARRANDR